MNKTELPHFEVLPSHIAFIMDGNGRWAQSRGLPRTEGHKVGANNFRTIVDYAADLGVKYLTFYAFSTENWSRPALEVETIMNLIRDYLDEMKRRENENEERGYNISFIGRRDNMPRDIVELFETVERDSAARNKTYINVAVNYGGREEIAQAARALAQDALDGRIQPQDIDEKMLNSRLYTANQPDPDLIIRPSGEQRLSNFLIWQSAYSEFWFSDVMWPDFSPAELNKALESYSHRHRRFGGV